MFSKLRFSAMLMLGAGLFYACSEELTPAQQLQQQLVELDASQYISFIAVVEDNGEPLAGATVTLTTVSVDTAGGTDTTGAAAGEIISQSATTDADGRAVFAAVQPGGHILEVTAEGHYATRAVADFDFVEGYNYTITDGFLVPTAVVESAILPLFATDAATVGNTATIEGTLTIETDVTNLAPEVLANTRVTADLSSLTAIVSDGLAVRGYSIREGQGFGTTTTDANGRYSMVVPASENGTFISLNFPEIEADQTVIANGRGTTVFDQPETITVKTTFGPNIFRDSNIPGNPGVKAVFPTPPTGGEGFSLSNLSRVGRALPATFLDAFDVSPFWTGSVVYEFAFGEGYETSPEVIITDATGNGADILAYLNVEVSGYTIVEADSGYSANSSNGLELYVDYLSTFSTDTFTTYLTEVTVFADANGVIGQTQVNDAIAQAIEDGRNYFQGNPFSFTSGEITRIYFELDDYNNFFASDTELMGTPTNDGGVYGYSFQASGADYTNPTITVTGGGGSGASLSIRDFGTRWTFDFDNSGNTGTYVIPPDILWEYEAVALSSNFTSYENTYNVYNPNQGSNEHFDRFTYVSSGNITFDGDQPLQTSFFAAVEPVFYVQNENPTQARAFLSLANDGSLDDFVVENVGNGYNGRFDVSIEPLLSTMGGSGAEITLIGGSQSGDEYQWQGNFIINNAGSGYQVYANQALNYLSTSGLGWTSNGSTSFTISAGDTVVRDVDYGTGNREETIF